MKGQADKAERIVKRGGAHAWNRHRMNETHRKGKRQAKRKFTRARRRLDRVIAGQE